MTALERLRVRISDEQNDNLLYEMLESSKDIILSLRFPYGGRPQELPEEYNGLQVDIAEDIYNRLGASGQLSHSENSISRTWGSEWVSSQLLHRIVPKVGGLK